MMLYNIEAVIIVMLGIYVFIRSIVQYRRYKFWVDVFLAVVGMLWAVLYGYILFVSPLSSAWIGQTFARPLVWITLVLLISLRELANMR